ncbi:uncharacterized protein METZ01_LOCUS391781, partial [marine metagenome]
LPVDGRMTDRLQCPEAFVVGEDHPGQCGPVHGAIRGQYPSPKLGGHRVANLVPVQDLAPDSVHIDDHRSPFG